MPGAHNKNEGMTIYIWEQHWSTIVLSLTTCIQQVDNSYYSHTKCYNCIHKPAVALLRKRPPAGSCYIAKFPIRAHFRLHAAVFSVSHSMAMMG